MTHITLTSSARNGAAYVERCIRSVREQTHQDWTHHYLVEDASTDGTLDLAMAARWTKHRFEPDATRDPRFKVSLCPSQRSSDAVWHASILPIWRALPPEEVIVWLDGDDALLVPKALEIVAQAHEAGAWVTYGTFVTTDGHVPEWQSDAIGPTPRRAPWRSSHLKTFRAGLVQKIDPAHLADGYARDRAVMYPCLEMAAERAVYINRLLYLYNTENSFAVNAPAEEQARELEAVRRIVNYPRYKRLESLT